MPQTPMPHTMLHLSRAWPLLAVTLLAAPMASQANDFPTVDRVLYVQECMRNHAGPNYEMVNKCSCALDKLATELPYDDYVTMSTAANATTIGGERGSYIRDAEGLQVLIRKYKELQTRVKKACFILPP